MTQKLFEELTKFFKPELLNRFDEIIVFKPLSAIHMRAIAVIGLNNTRKLLREQKLGLEVSETAITQLAQIGFDPIFGARPLRRAIQTQIENPISTLLIGKRFSEEDTVIVDFDPEKNVFTFSRRPQQKII